MPKYKLVKHLEELSLNALVLYICDLGDQLMPLISQNFTLKRNIDKSDVSTCEENEDIDDIFEDREDEEAANADRRKSIENARRNSNQQKKASDILRDRIRFLHNIFQYNVPCFLYDKLCDRLFYEIPRMVERIKCNRSFKTTTGEFLCQVNVAVSLIEVAIGPYLTYCNLEEMPKILHQVFYARLKTLSGLEYLNLGSMTGGWKTGLFYSHT